MYLLSYLLAFVTGFSNSIYRPLCHSLQGLGCYLADSSIAFNTVY
jgi:hypothetical protein